MNLLERSYNANPRNPLTLRYLADHYFFKNDLQISEMLSQSGLEILKNKKRPDGAELPSFRREIDLLRSDFNFILGKINHVQGKYQEAFTFYNEAIKIDNINHQA